MPLFRSSIFFLTLAFQVFIEGASANILLNQDFESPVSVTLNNGNNITTSLNFTVPNWDPISGSGALNLIQVDGPGGYNYANLGPESDADYSGTAIKHYIDIVNSAGGMFQDITIPLCADGLSSPVDVHFGAEFTNRQNAGGNIPASIAIFSGSTSVASTGASTFPGLSPTQTVPWVTIDSNATLTRGVLYRFIISMHDFSNVDNPFLIIQPASACGRTVGSTGGTSEFLQARNTMLLANEPDRHRRLDKINRTRSLSGANEASERLPFDLMFNGTNASFAASVGRLDMENALGAWDFWVEGYLSGFIDDATDGGLFGIGYAGVDYQIGETALFGVLFQLDHLDLDFDTPGDSIDGTGWMVGPYLTIKLHEKLFFDLRGAWGQSTNSIEAAGTVSGKFDSNRWLVSGALIGDIQHGNWEVRPELQARYISEHQNTFDNNGTIIEAQTVSQGEVRFGPRIAYHYITDNDLMVTPYMRVDGVYSFATNGKGAPAEGSVALALDDALRVRIEAGLDVYSLDGFKFTLSGHYDGIGQENYQIFGGMLRFGLALN